MESKALEKSTNDIVASRFFACTPSRIRRIVKICDVVGRFLWKLFWFFLLYLQEALDHLRSLYLLSFAFVVFFNVKLFSFIRSNGFRCM